MSGPHFHARSGAFQYLIGPVLLSAGVIARGASIVSDDLSVKYDPREGARICFHGVPVVRGSGLQLYAPGWTRGYYSTHGTPPTVSGDKTQIVVTHHVAKDMDFDATETLRLIDADHIEIVLEGKVATDAPVQLEWTLGYLNAFALYGGGYAAGDDKPTPIVAMAPRDTGDCTVIRKADRIRFSGILGDIEFKFADSAAMSLLDGRLELGRNWSQEIPSFWIGCLDKRLTSGEPFKFAVTISYQPAPRPEVASAVHATAKSHDVADAFVPQSSPVLVIPQPKKLAWHDGALRVKSLSDVVRFEYQKLQPERYEIHCDQKGVQILAGDDRGKLYATKTLEQLIQSDADGDFIRFCDIDDWPTMKFRGVHLFPGKGALEMHRKLIERIFAGFKLNTIVLECEYAQWETNPKLWTEISVPKEDLREYAKIVRQNLIEPIPLVQSLGHAEWMFKNGQNRDLAEDPRAGWAYDATNPATYDFIEKIYDEAIDIFHPRFFHVGHDEVNHRGEYPYREASKKLSVAELFGRDVKTLDEYFRPKGIRMMLWGDMMLTNDESSDPAANASSAQEATEIRASIPKDAIICDWHYQPAKPQAFKSLGVFKDSGLQVVGCTWYNPLNIWSFSSAVRDTDSLGLLQTTWAGFNLDEQAMQKEFRQFSAYVLAAEYAWSGQSVSPEALGYRADEAFARAFNPTHTLRRACKGSCVDLSEVANVTLEDLAAGPVDHRYAGVRFDLSGARAVALGGALRREVLPTAVQIQIAAQADSIAFLQACGFRAEPNEGVGHYQVVFVDGSTETVPLKYGANIRATDDLATTSDAALAFSGKGANGQGFCARLFEWKNPHPEKIIARVDLLTDHPYASPMLIGMTLLRDSEDK